MHAIVIHEGGGPEVLRFEEVPDPEPGDGQVLVKVEAAAVNHYDLSVRANPGDSLPVIPGVDAAGTRVDTGERVLVTGQPGAYAELIAAPADLVRPVPARGSAFVRSAPSRLPTTTRGSRIWGPTSSSTRSAARSSSGAWPRSARAGGWSPPARSTARSSRSTCGR